MAVVFKLCELCLSLRMKGCLFGHGIQLFCTKSKFVQLLSHLSIPRGEVLDAYMHHHESVDLH